MMMKAQTRGRDSQDSVYMPIKSQFGQRPLASLEPEHEFLDRGARSGHSFGEIDLLPIQPKLIVGPPDDKYEREADQVAEQVIHMPKPCSKCQPEVEDLQAKPISDQITPLAKRQESVPEVEVEEEGLIQPKHADRKISQLDSDLEMQVRSIRGGGRPLPESTRNFFEPRFGHDFGRVRVHTDAKAAKLVGAVKARAFTMGRDMVFGARRFAPGTSGGQRLLAHELVHVVQQDSPPIVAQLKVNSPSNESEHEADQVADNIMHATHPNVRTALSTETIQRDCPPPEELGRIPAPEPCIEDDPTVRAPDHFGVPLRFCFDSDDLIDADAGNISVLRSRLGILLLAAGRSVHIHGYSSEPGGRIYNSRLACHRAAAVKRLLGLRTINPIILHSHGETTIFGAQPENQRVIVSVDPPPRTPTPGCRSIAITPGSSTPFFIGSRAPNSCGCGSDFTYNDFPSLSSGNRVVVELFKINYPLDIQKEMVFRTELGVLAGMIGQSMITRFLAGTGGTWVHDLGSRLSVLATTSPSVLTAFSAVRQSIDRQIRTQAAACNIDFRSLSVSAPIISFTWSDGATLRAAIGGTQGLDIFIKDFNVTPGSRTWTAILRFEICDDFGVDESDLYSPGLIAFWILQHERSGNQPFINQIIVEAPIDGVF